ncbi:5'-nucleotidase [Bacillus pakistanensis]|uniref:5'-nucleotidase n=1 Tax=Rossellomorea pakistanensis TaxID=992288 RepID=A0ABS2NGX1_9BACI|nr:bifunctional UDP-sugar hydrolase/5'-nucleotidase [Bacillus pakistanensis]MBM7587116.1 5'-nucleotidase [Bacillus pakistanensis]
MKQMRKHLLLLLVFVLLVGNGLMGSLEAFASTHARQSPVLTHTEGGPSSKEELNHEDLVELQILGLTDFHGYLKALNDKNNGQINSPDGPITVGGAAYMATHLRNLKAGKENSILFSAGDDFSGWPFEVAAHREEPTIEFLNAIGLDFSVAGNHEFDVSSDFLKNHIMNGKCFGVINEDSCFNDSTGQRFQGADYEYISANVREADSGNLVLKPYVIKQIPDGKGNTIPVGFIGLTTPTTVEGSTSFQVGALTNDPLLESANKYAKVLKEMGIKTIIAVVHEGGSTKSDAIDFNGCDRPFGPIFDFAKQASAEIDAIIGGHWHAKFNCSIDDPEGNPRPVIEGANHGRLISEINLSIDPVSKDVVREMSRSLNHPVTRDVPADPVISKMVAYWDDKGKERWAKPIARQTDDLTRARNDKGESTLANVAADAHLAAGKKAANPADFALTAASPLRGDLLYNKGKNPADSDGQILFGEQWHAHGYANPVLVVTFKGQQIKEILEEQWRLKPDGSVSFHPLAVSQNVHYTYNVDKELNHRINPDYFLINGEPLDLERTYRVAALAYIVIGADGYETFKEYRDPVRVGGDYWVFLDYLKNQKVIEPPALHRVTSTTLITMNEIQNVLNHYVNSGDVEKPLDKGLSSRLKMAEHHFNQNSEDKAIKELEKFITYVDKRSMQRFISQEAHDVLEVKARALMEKWL